MLTELNAVTDALTLVGLLAVPSYSIYWLQYHRAGRLPRRRWLGPAVLVIWGAATYLCFVRLAIGCVGGHCGDRVSPFLELAVAYVVVSLALVAWMHRARAR